jgi:hypothetical protein
MSGGIRWRPNWWRTRKAVLAENDRLRSLLDESVEVRVQRMCADEGGIDMVLRGGLLPAVVEMFAVAFEEHNATNYLEIKGHHERLGFLTVTIQKCDGKTPHELRMAAEAELAKLKAGATP